MTDGLRSPTKQAIVVKDLREGKYMAIAPHKFSENILLAGETFYEVQNNTSWKRIDSPIVEETT